MRKLVITITMLVLVNNLMAQVNGTSPKSKQEKGYFNITEFGYFIGESNLRHTNQTISSGLTVRSLRTVNGIFLNPKLSVGVGIGADGYDTKSYGFFNTFLIYADARYYLNNRINGWFAYTDIGKSVKIDDNIENGLLLNVGAGYKFNLGKTFFVPSLGFNNQNFKRDNAEYKNYSVAIKLGLLF